jgi:hypothetical protein
MPGGDRVDCCVCARSGDGTLRPRRVSLPPRHLAMSRGFASSPHSLWTPLPLRTPSPRATATSAVRLCSARAPEPSSPLAASSLSRRTAFNARQVGDAPVQPACPVPLRSCRRRAPVTRPAPSSSLAESGALWSLPAPSPGLFKAGTRPSRAHPSLPQLFPPPELSNGCLGRRLCPLEFEQCRAPPLLLATPVEPQDLSDPFPHSTLSPE